MATHKKVHLYVVTRVEIQVPAEQPDEKAIDQALETFFRDPLSYIYTGEYADEYQGHALVDTVVDGNIEYEKAKWYKESTDQTKWFPFDEKAN